MTTDQLTGNYSDFITVKSINLEMITGKWLSIIGANCSGKSTLLKLLPCLLPPQTGIFF